MWKLVRYLKDYKKESIIGPLFKMLEAFFELLVPMVVADMVDRGISNGDRWHILRCTLILVLFGVLGLACSLTAQYFAAKASVGFGTKLRDDMFAQINRFSYAELDRIGTSKLVTRITNDVNQVQTGVNMVLRLFLRSPFLVIGALVAAFRVNKKIALIFLVTTPILALVIYGIMVISIPMFAKVQKALDKILLGTREGIRGGRVIRAFNRQADEVKEFDEDCDRLMKRSVGVGRISALMNPLTYVIVNLAIAAIIMQGGEQTDNGILTQGRVVALVNYMTQILNALVAMQVLITSFTKAIASAKRVNEVMDIVPLVQERENVTEIQEKEKGTLAFSEVSFTYPGAGEEVLTQLSFRINPGETVGIIGSIGSGKSTLANLCMRFYDVCDGAVFADGVDVREYPLLQLRNKFGFVPQKAVLFAGSVRDNMKWGKEDATDEEIIRALKIAQAWDFIEKKEEGLSFELAQGGKNLSGGQKQRLTIARALVRNPEFLILDDSASALDMATDAALRKALKKETAGMTVLMISQRVATVQNADRILVLDDGKMVGLGSHSELLSSCEVYREICQSQHSEEEAAV